MYIYVACIASHMRLELYRLFVNACRCLSEACVVYFQITGTATICTEVGLQSCLLTMYMILSDVKFKEIHVPNVV